MKAIVSVLAAGALLLPLSAAHAQSPNHSFDVHADAIGGAIVLNGGGSYNPLTGSLHGGGGFRVTSDINGGPLAGLRAGDSGHWEASALLRSSGFKCSSSPAEPLKTATTDDDTAVFTANFFRDGDVSPLAAKVFVSAQDEDTLAPGIQNVWIQAVGCDEANANVR